MKQQCIARQLKQLVQHLEAMRVAEYMELLERPFRLIAINLLAGVARGLGIAIGATVVFAVLLKMLHQLIMLNLPGIGGVIADIITIVEQKNGKF